MPMPGPLWAWDAVDLAQAIRTRAISAREAVTASLDRLAAVIEKARRLNLPTSAYILSMALLEVSQVMQAIGVGEENDATS